MGMLCAIILIIFLSHFNIVIFVRGNLLKVLSFYKIHVMKNFGHRQQSCETQTGRCCFSVGAKNQQERRPRLLDYLYHYLFQSLFICTYVSLSIYYFWFIYYKLYTIIRNIIFHLFYIYDLSDYLALLSFA